MSKKRPLQQVWLEEAIMDIQLSDPKEDSVISEYTEFSWDDDFEQDDEFAEEAEEIVVEVIDLTVDVIDLTVDIIDLSED